MEKLRIFISGTQLDMQPERRVVSCAVNTVAPAESICAETALSYHQSPRAWIVEQIRSCDIYVGVYSHRYGWIIPEENVSATEFEFNLAYQLRKPILIWIRKLQDVEKSLPNFERQQRFLQRVTDFSHGYLRQEFEDLAELENQVVDALRQTIISIIRQETRRPGQFQALPSPALLEAYLQEVARQRPYALWTNETYIDRTVTMTRDLFTRTVTLYRPCSPEQEKKLEPLEEVLTREKKLMLLGEPGMGKTTSLLHLAWEAANKALSLTDSAVAHDLRIPVYVELKYYSGEPELEMLLARRINDLLRARNLMLAPDLAEGTRVLKTWLMQPDARFLLLFDGLNEVRPKFHTEVRGLLQAMLNSPHDIIISCRERDYDQSLGDHITAFILQMLQAEEILDYLKRALGKAGAELFERRISRNEKMQTLAANPLMLCLISQVALNDSEYDLPINRGKLFQQFIAHMPRLRMSEAIKVRIPFDVVMRSLAQLGFEMQERGLLTSDLGEARGWHILTEGCQLEDVLVQAKEWRFLKADGIKGEPIEFLHQLLLEYFAAAHFNNQLLRGNSYTEVLGERPFSDQWAEVIVTLAGIISRPVELIEWLSTQAIIKKEKRLVLLAESCWWNTTRYSNDVESKLALAEAFIALWPTDYNFQAYILIEELGESGDQRAVGPILKALEYRGGVRTVAAEALGKIVDQRTVKPLIAALSDEMASPGLEFVKVGNLVVDALAKMGAKFGSPVVSLLVAALRDEKVCRYVARALVKIGALAVEPLVTALLDKHANVRLIAARVLGLIGDPRVVKALIITLQDEDAEVRQSAADSLAKIGAPAVTPLITLLRY